MEGAWTVHGSGRPPGPEQCEILFELSPGNGLVSLGRLLRGHDAGRLVTLRRITGREVALAPVVDIARSIAHPSLAKVLGIARAQGQAYLASEYLPGVSLLELRQAVITRSRPLAVAAAVRIIVDALKATAAAQRVLREVTGVDAGRHLFAEHVCVAEYGETLLSEVGIGAQLASEQDGAAVDDDVRSAALELYALLTARPFVGPWCADGSLPPALEAALGAVLGGGSQAARDVTVFLHELTDSRTTPLASEQGVSEALRTVVGDVLDTRRRKLDLLERASAWRDADESTQFYRASEFAALQERDTARPPAEPAESTPAVPVAARVPSEQAAVLPEAAPLPAPRFEVEDGGEDDTASAEDEATQFWRRPQSAEPAATTLAASEPVLLEDEAAIASFRPGHASRWLLLLAVLLLLLAAIALRFER